jgi:hypothetical protein
LLKEIIMKTTSIRFFGSLRFYVLAAVLGFALPGSIIPRSTFARDPDQAKASAAPARAAGASSAAPSSAAPPSAVPASVKNTAAADPDTAKKSASDSDSTAAAAEDPLEELADRRAEIDARYAEVYLKIAELNLRSALDANTRVPNTVAPAEVDRLRQIVRLAKVQSKAAEGTEGADDESLTIENDNGQVKMAQEALRRTIAASNRAPGVVPRIELDRLRLLTELGRLQLAKDKVAAEEKKAAGELRKRFTQLEKQVKDLQATVDRLSERASAIPVPAKTASLPAARSQEAKAKKP